MVAQRIAPRLSCTRSRVLIRASTNVSFSMHNAVSKFTLDITGIGEGKHREETWTIINISLKSLTRPEQAWRSMLMVSLYEKRPLPSSGTVIGWYDEIVDLKQMAWSVWM